MSALKFQNVRKRYGKNQALDGMSFEIKRGALVGFVGPNGAGKTTTFGIASGAIAPNEGSVDVLGQGAFDPRKHAGRVSVLPQDCALNPHSSARQLMVFYGALQGLSRKDARKEADRLLELVELTDRCDSRVRQLSHGMRRRLAVAQALIATPSLILLDEPTGGLDPHLVIAMRRILRSLRGKSTVVVSTHILTDVEDTCDEVLFVDAGRCVTHQSIAELTGRGTRVRIKLAKKVEESALREALGDRGCELEGDELRYSIAEDEDLGTTQARLLAQLLKAGAQVLEVQLGERLEDAYMRTRASKEH